MTLIICFDFQKERGGFVMNLKRIIFTFLCIVAISLFFSCDKSPSNDLDAVTISLSWWGGESRHEVTQQAVNAFMEENPDIKVDIQFGSWDGWEDKMSTAFFSSTASDVNQINWNWITTYSADGKMFFDMNLLDDYFDLTQYSEETLSLCTVGGKLQAIPVSITGRIFYWNKTVFDKALIRPPKSMDELYIAGGVFKEKLGEDFYPLALGEYDRMILMVYYLESLYGKEWVLDGRLNYSTEEILKGMEFIQSLEDAHVIPSISDIIGDGASSFDKNPKWINGKYGGIFEWDTSASKFAEALGDEGEFIVGSFFDDFGDYNGGFSKISLAFAISENTKHPKECAMLLDFLLNNPKGASIMSSERGIPLSASAFKVCSDRGLINPIVRESNEKIMRQTKLLSNPLFEDSRLRGNDGCYYDVFSGLSYKDYTPEKAAKLLSEGINNVLKE